MTINLIDIDTYNLLKSIQESYPNLTYQNIGYDYPDKSKWTDEDTKQHRVVTDILKKAIKDFIQFNHFKINKNDNNAVVLRFQYKWSNSFIGVGYVKLDELLKNKEYKSLTEQDIIDVIKKIFNENEDKNKERKVVLGRFCIDKGWVNSSGIELNICSNPDCASCRMFDDLIKKEVENLPFNLSE